MKFATVSTLRSTTQPAIVVGDRVHTLPYPDMLAVIAAGAEVASKKAAKESLSLDEVKFAVTAQAQHITRRLRFRTAREDRQQESRT
ncbi:MAG: hypothetical protein U0V48_18345 [Anaerolineales bacterium]